MREFDPLPFPDNQYHTHTWERLVRSWLCIDRAELTLRQVYRQLDEAQRVLHPAHQPLHHADADHTG